MENWIKWVIGISILLLTPILFKLLFVDFIDQHELGYKFDARTGQISVLKEKGYIVSPPVLVKISTIDLRPFQVCINANSRVPLQNTVQLTTKVDRQLLIAFVSKRFLW